MKTAFFVAEHLLVTYLVTNEKIDCLKNLVLLFKDTEIDGLLVQQYHKGQLEILNQVISNVKAKYNLEDLQYLEPLYNLQAEVDTAINCHSAIIGSTDNVG